MCERPVTERYLGNPTPVTCCRHSVLVIEPSSHSDSLRKDLLQFGRRSSRDERSNESECVVVEVSLKKKRFIRGNIDLCDVRGYCSECVCVRMRTVLMRESRTETAKAVPQANGCVMYSSVSGSSSSS